MGLAGRVEGARDVVVLLRTRGPVRRLSALALVSIVLVLVAGCGGNQSGGPDAAVQKQVRSDLISQLEALPGAKVTASIESSLDGGQNNVGVDARLAPGATTAQLNAVGDSIERAIWLSRLDPLGLININFTRAGSSVRVLQRLYQDATQTRPLHVKYGPRPDGLPDFG